MYIFYDYYFHFWSSASTEAGGKQCHSYILEYVIEVLGAALNEESPVGTRCFVGKFN